MKPIPLIESPQALPPGYRLLRSFHNEVLKYDESFIVTPGGYLIIKDHPRNQCVLPIGGLREVHDFLVSCLRPKTRESDFRWNCEVSASGESIEVTRGVSLGGDDVPGFTVTNCSRHSYILVHQAQAHDFLDHHLIDRGLLDFLGELVARNDRGEFAMAR